jgi:hypothetical protein
LVTGAEARKVLEAVMDPELHESLIELGMVRQVRIEDYAGEDFAPIAQDLAKRAPAAQQSSFVQAHAGR